MFIIVCTVFLYLYYTKPFFVPYQYGSRGNKIAYKTTTFYLFSRMCSCVHRCVFLSVFARPRQCVHARLETHGLPSFSERTCTRPKQHVSWCKYTWNNAVRRVWKHFRLVQREFNYRCTEKKLNFLFGKVLNWIFLIMWKILLFS